MFAHPRPEIHISEPLGPRTGGAVPFVQPYPAAPSRTKRFLDTWSDSF